MKKIKKFEEFVSDNGILETTNSNVNYDRVVNNIVELLEKSLKEEEKWKEIMEDVEIKNSEVDKVDHDFIEKSKTIIQQKDQIISEYKNKFDIILSRAKEEKTTFGKNKIVIEFSPLEFENFKDLV